MQATASTSIHRRCTTVPGLILYFVAYILYLSSSPSSKRAIVALSTAYQGLAFVKGRPHVDCRNTISLRISSYYLVVDYHLFLAILHATN